ncbi:unnamed protein product [Ixodes pacificus]
MCCIKYIRLSRTNKFIKSTDNFLKVLFPWGFHLISWDISRVNIFFQGIITIKQSLQREYGGSCLTLQYG